MSGVVVWFTGPPSAGKSTLARAVREELQARGVACCLLDGDEVRQALEPPPGYGEDERRNFYRTLARLAALLARQGLTVLAAATAHRREYRGYARENAPRFVEVFVDTPLDECARRDTKGLYAKAHAGEVSGLPGAQTDYERPHLPEVIAPGGAGMANVDKVIEALARVSDNPRTT